MIIEGTAGAFLTRLVGTVTQRFTGCGSVAVSQVEGAKDEAARAGITFHCNALTATGIAPVQALPTTAASWMFYNSAANSVTAFFDRLGIALATGTAGAGASLLACVVAPGNQPASVPTVSATGVVIKNANPVSSKTSKLLLVASKTLISTTESDWMPVAVMNPAGTVLGQVAFDTGWGLNGSIVIPPGCGLGLVVISPTGTTPLFTPFATWREYAVTVD